MCAAKRDPVSEVLDRGARDLLTRAYGAKRNEWVMTRLADPSAAHKAWAKGMGIDLDGPDNAPTLSGKRQNAHTRWGRAFTRALYYNHKHYGPETRRRGAAPAIRTEKRTVPTDTPLEVEWGRRLRRLGVIPAGRAVRVRLRYGGQTALRAVRAKENDNRTFTDDGELGGRWSDPLERDWASVT